jgi:uncharacterized membrane protein YpjA
MIIAEEWGSDLFDKAATALRLNCNFTVMTVACVALAIVYGIIHKAKKSPHSPITPIVLIIHSTGTLYIAISALAAFTLTRTPPLAVAFEKNEWRVVGAYIFITGLFYGLYQTVRVFRAPFGGAAVE